MNDMFLCGQVLESPTHCTDEMVVVFKCAILKITSEAINVYIGWKATSTKIQYQDTISNDTLV